MILQPTKPYTRKEGIVQSQIKDNNNNENHTNV
jgi:hypothetical protein